MFSYILFRDILSNFAVLPFILLWLFQVKIGKHMIRDREWEVYRILLDEGVGYSVPRNKIEEGVRNKLMGWE